MIVLLALLTIAVYLPALGGGFVYDDLNWVGSLAGPVGSWALLPFHLVARTGPEAWRLHLLVLAFHLAGGLILWSIAARWLSPAAALVVVALFWLHPIRVSSVAYVTGGLETYIAFLVLLAVWAGPSAVGALALVAAAEVKWSALPVLVAVPAVWAWWAAPAGLVVSAIAAWSRPELSAWLARTWHAAGGRLELLSTFGDQVAHGFGRVLVPRGPGVEFGTLPHIGAAWWVLGAAGLLAWGWRPAWLAAAWVGALLLPRGLVLHDGSPLTDAHLALPLVAVWLLFGFGAEWVLNHKGAISVWQRMSKTGNPRISTT